jgi:molybdopterin converting factor small subunit
MRYFVCYSSKLKHFEQDKLYPAVDTTDNNILVMHTCPKPGEKVNSTRFTKKGIYAHFYEVTKEELAKQAKQSFAKVEDLKQKLSKAQKRINWATNEITEANTALYNLQEYYDYKEIDLKLWQIKYNNVIKHQETIKEIENV